MNFRSIRRLVAACLFAGAVAGCQEELTTPGSCPATCPGGTPIVHDTILDAIVGGDTSHIGYVGRGAGTAGLRVSNGFLSDTDYAVLKFDPIPDSVNVSVDTLLHAFTIDSAVIEIPLLARDTLTNGVLLAMHRLPVAIDSAATFADVLPYIVPGTIIDSVTIADSTKAPHTYKFVFKGDTLASIAIPAADSGVLAFAVAITAPSSTGIRIGGAGTFATGGNPIFRIFITVDVADTTTSVRKQVLGRSVQLSTFVSSSPTPFDPDLLTIGTLDGARALIRFPWPAYLKDTALIARATLELPPIDTIGGLPGDSAWVDLYGVTADFGAKSPPTPLRGTRGLVFGSIDTLRIDVISEVVFWQTGVVTIPHPPMLRVQLAPDGGSFTEPRFRSTRSAGGRPRLHLTYQLPFDFERP